jgi:hypothetical protein
MAGGGTAVTTFSAGTTGLTPSTATSGAVTLGGTLAVANGGTGSATKNFVDLTTTQTVAGEKTFSNNFDVRSGNTFFGSVKGYIYLNEDQLNFGYSTNADATFNVNVNGYNNAQTKFRNYGIYNGKGSLVFFINGANNDITVSDLIGTGSRTVLADDNGVLSAPVSSINTKENVQILNYGLNELLQINPVSFNYINKDKWGEERNLGFIVEDMFPIIPEVTGTMNNGDMYLDMTKLIPILTKAIQEQQALIKALEQRIINIENK